MAVFHMDNIQFRMSFPKDSERASSSAAEKSRKATFFEAEIFMRTVLAGYISTYTYIHTHMKLCIFKD